MLTVGLTLASYFSGAFFSRSTPLDLREDRGNVRDRYGDGGSGKVTLLRGWAGGGAYAQGARWIKETNIGRYSRGSSDDAASSGRDLPVSREDPGSFGQPLDAYGDLLLEFSSGASAAFGAQDRVLLYPGSWLVAEHGGGRALGLGQAVLQAEVAAHTDPTELGGSDVEGRAKPGASVDRRFTTEDARIKPFVSLPVLLRTVATGRIIRRSRNLPRFPTYTGRWQSPPIAGCWQLAEARGVQLPECTRYLKGGA